MCQLKTLLQDLQLLEATECDYDLLVKVCQGFLFLFIEGIWQLNCQAELNTLTESRRNSQADHDNSETAEGNVNTLADLNIEVENHHADKNEMKTTRQDYTLLMIIAWISFMVGYLFEDISVY